MDLNRTVDETLNAAVDLIEVTSFETELLAFLRPTELAPIMKHKQEVANFYTSLLKKLERRKASFGELPEVRRDEILAVNDWLRLIVGENARALRAAFEASERFLHAVKRAVQTVRGEEAPTYSRAGKMRKLSKTSDATRASLGYNEVS